MVNIQRSRPSKLCRLALLLVFLLRNFGPQVFPAISEDSKQRQVGGMYSDYLSGHLPNTPKRHLPPRIFQVLRGRHPRHDRHLRPFPLSLYIATPITIFFLLPSSIFHSKVRRHSNFRHLPPSLFLSPGIPITPCQPSIGSHPCMAAPASNLVCSLHRRCPLSPDQLHHPPQPLPRSLPLRRQDEIASYYSISSR